MQMKKLSLLKMIQLTALVVLTIISFCLLLNKDIKQYVFSHLSATILFGVIWLVLVTSFVFLLLDFKAISALKLNYHNLYEVAFSDPLSGIPNRFSCDVLIEKYIDRELPDNIGCVMLDLTNLPEINSAYSHAAGNKLLADYSSILSAACASAGFVGRNGGNKFLAIFEDCTEETLSDFLKRVDIKVNSHNSMPEAVPIEYKSGCALNSTEQLSQITKLIALANHRVYK